jgi:WD40 repeat protein
VRLAHEALITHWKRARSQIAQDRDDLRTRDAIEEALAAHRAAPAGRQRKYLLRDPLLANAADLAARWRADFDAETLRFVQTSRRRALLLQQVVAAAAAIFAAVAIFAGWQYYDANAAKQDAERQRDLARQQTGIATDKTREAELSKQQTLTERNNALRAQSLFLARESTKATQSGRSTLGILLALAALPKDLRRAERPFVPEAESALTNAYSNRRERSIISQDQLDGRSVSLSDSGAITFIHAGDELRITSLWTTDKSISLRPVDRQMTVTSLQFSRDGSRILVIGKLGGQEEASLWDASTGAMIAGFPPRPKVSGFFSPDGQRLMISSDSIELVESVTGRRIRTLRGQAGQALDGEVFSPDGKWLVANANGTKLLWQVDTGTLVKSFDRGIGSLTFSPDSQLLLSISFDIQFELWRTFDGTRVADLGGHNGWQGYATFSPDSTRLITWDWDNAWLWNTKDGRLIRDLKRKPEGHEKKVTFAVFSPDGRRLVTTSVDTTARLWNAGSGAHIATMSGPGEINFAAFSPNGERLLTNEIADDNPMSRTNPESPYLWDGRTGQIIRPLSGHAGSVNSARFSAQDNVIATVSTDKSVRLWDADTGVGRAVIADSDEILYSVWFSPNGARFITKSEKGTIRLWDVNPPRTSSRCQELIETAQRELPRHLTPSELSEAFLDPSNATEESAYETQSDEVQLCRSGVP